MSFKPEDVKGVVRNKDTTHTIHLTNGKKVVLDKSDSNSLLNRLDKDKSKIEKDIKKQR